MTEDNQEPARLLTDYGELYLLLEVEPETLHEAISDCEPSQLEQIMKCMEDQLDQLQYTGPSKLPQAQQFLTVWFMALRVWDKKTSPDGELHRTNLEFETLKYDQHWKS